MNLWNLQIKLMCILLVVAVVAGSPVAFAEEGAAGLVTARESILSSDLKRHVDVLADDTFEGRATGSRGGRAAAGYLRKQFEKYGLKPAGEDGGYYQAFGGGSNNLLAILPGSDEKLRDEYILVGAHYDHVGYGTARNSYGPTGYIHNGADDNASGTAGLLELIEAITSLPNPPRRSILFAFWDGEEAGLLGSKHWARNPTVPLAQIKLAFNLDMIGRLRNQKLEVAGTRTARGLRRLISEQNGSGEMSLDFTWELKENSDHHSFFERGIPILMFHTGLHDDYHRPSDDAHKINTDGMQQVVRLLLDVVFTLANEPNLSGFRKASRQEANGNRLMLERAIEPPPARLGVAWHSVKADEPAEGLTIAQVVPDSAASRAGLKVGDTLLEIDGRPITDADDFRGQILAAEKQIELKVRRPMTEEPLSISVQLAGSQVRVGVAWREDEAEPGVALVVQLIPGSPADRAGVLLGDRIHRIAGKAFQGNDECRKLLTESPAPLELEVERSGRMLLFSLPVPPLAAEPEVPSP